MGTWGHGTFENDDASDWLVELEKARDFSAIEAALDAAVGAAGTLESSDCSNALAAAEVVAALRGKPPAELPPEVAAWVSGAIHRRAPWSRSPCPPSSGSSATPSSRSCGRRATGPGTGSRPSRT